MSQGRLRNGGYDGCHGRQEIRDLFKHHNVRRVEVGGAKLSLRNAGPQPDTDTASLSEVVSAPSASGPAPCPHAMNRAQRAAQAHTKMRRASRPRD